MMNGVLSVKKDTLSDEGLVRPAWMDELDPKDMSELQVGIYICVVCVT